MPSPPQMIYEPPPPDRLTRNMIVYRNFEGDIRQLPGRAGHDVTFKEATTVFSAEDLMISEDAASGQLRAVGTSARGRKLVVLHQRGQRIRILGVTLEGEHEGEIAEPVEGRAAGPAIEPAVVADVDGQDGVDDAGDVEGGEAADADARKLVVVASALDLVEDPPASAPARAARRPARRRVDARGSVPPAPSEPIAEEAASKSPVPGTAWTAETYDVYWKAYSAARQEARLQGKSTREAQRLVREAGERAVSTSAEPAPPTKRTSRSGTWRAAARTVKLVG